MDRQRFETHRQDGLVVLTQSGERLLCRGWRADGDGGAALAVFPTAEHPAPACLERLAHEYGLKDELDRAWAVRPLEFVREPSQAVLVLEDPGGEPLEWLLGKPMEIGRFMRLAANIAAVLGKVHQRGLVHKDIKPANILLSDAGEVHLTGFGIASRLPRERQAPDPPGIIAGTLAYMAPEQTGRMNRSVDARSDLYAFGVTLYELLTGSLPFTATDPLEWVHCHIARQPLSPAERCREIPRTVSAIIMKLLAKTAEDRYQTAAGVEHDLRRCLAEWEAERHIADFPLGARDTPDRLVMPEKLYGRARQIDTLLAAFDRVVSSGRPELVLVSGYSGIGKSSVVHELNRVLVPPRGLFASGKFDQYKRDIPYSTLAQAFQGLIRSLLSHSEGELNEWRDALLDALGPNGHLIVNLVPELRLIIGDPPTVPELPLQDAQRRFQLVFRRFIGVFAKPEHPLVLFLDDLQWLDSATLDWIEDLLTQSDVRHLMLIGAYRDNEVHASHPLMRKLEAIRTAGAPVQEIVLEALTCEDLTQLSRDALHCEPERATALAELIHDKTEGNPFFTIQFISALVEEGLLTFDRGEGRWSWDLNLIRAKGYTDNVADLVVAKLQRLPIDTQRAVRQLACLGHSAPIRTLALVHGTSEQEIHAHLWEAVRNEMIERLESAYRFVHDRVQEAAYVLIPEEERAAAHLRIGRLLAAHTPQEKREEAIFELVSQLNRGVALIGEQEEREQLAGLNLMAGTRARNSTAYASALTYLRAGAELLAEDCWERQHPLAFALELNRADCELCTGALPPAEERLAALATRAVDTAQRAAVASRRVTLYTTVGANDRAVAIGLEFLRQVGIAWSAHPTEMEVRREYERIWTQLGSRAIEDLIDLPPMQDSESLATLDMLTALGSSAYADANLGPLTSCRGVNLSLEHGNNDASSSFYAAVGLLAAERFGDGDAGPRLAKLGCDLTERHGVTRFAGRTHAIAAMAVPWTRPLREGLDPLRRAFQLANEHGDPLHAAFTCNILTAYLHSAGIPLEQVEREAEHGLEFVRTARVAHIADMLSAALALVRTLRGETSTFGVLDDGLFTERSFEERMKEQPPNLPECFYWIRKLTARFFAGDYALAVEAAEKAERWLSTSASQSGFLLMTKAEYNLYAALSRAACCEPSGPDSYAKYQEALAAHVQRLRELAATCPENFEARAALVGAEIARVEGRPLEALELYERAIRSAGANGFVHLEALAHELAGRLCLQRGFETAGSAHLRHARACYALWDADGKVRQLDELYPYLGRGEREAGPTHTIAAPVEHLDLATVIKVSQAVSGEMVLEKLLEALMRTALEQAGAERGLLIVPGDGELRVEAVATTSGNAMILHLGEAPLAAEIPESVLRYVVRTQEPVILDDASAQTPFSDDAYIRNVHARSILCLPLIEQGRLVGVLHLENNLAPRVFTPNKIAVLKLLASRAAISLENARAEEALKSSEEALNRTRTELARVMRVATAGALTASIAHEVNQPLSGIITNASTCLRMLDANPPNLDGARETARRTIRDGNRASEVIARLRELFSKKEFTLESMDLNEATREVIALSLTELQRNRVVLRSELDEDLPIITGDRVQLQQVVLNLLRNASDAMADVNDRPRQLLIRTEQEDGDRVRLTVRDAGVGVDPQSVNKLFDAFHTTKSGGMGIGLFISRSIVERHCGRLWGESNDGPGATFSFSIPRALENA